VPADLPMEDLGTRNFKKLACSSRQESMRRPSIRSAAFRGGWPRDTTDFRWPNSLSCWWLERARPLGLRAGLFSAYSCSRFRRIAAIVVAFIMPKFW
jgi:hypothetical protein